VIYILGVFAWLYPIFAILFVTSFLQAIKKIVKQEEYTGHALLATISFLVVVLLPFYTKT